MGGVQGEGKGMTDFTTKNPGMPPVRHKPGKLGGQAAERGAKPGPSGSGASSSSRGGVTSPSRLTARGSGKESAAPPPADPETSDFRHAIVAAQYENMRRLGRDIPFGNWLIHNGHYRELLPNHGRPFDLFMDA
jgi:hypothetical protein